MATVISTTRPVSPLRQRMLHDMMMRGLLPCTQDQYVRRFAAYLGRPPDTATSEDLRNFQIRQHESGASAGTINGAISALRFLYTVTLRQRDLARGLVPTRRPNTVREVLSVEEAARLLEAAPGIKYKAALGVAYGAGLRVSEVAHLKVDDIDSQRMLILVKQGRHGKPEIFNTDQGSQFTSQAFTGALRAAEIKMSMDGRGRWMDNVFIERLWRSVKYECVYLHAFETGTELRAGLGRWFTYYDQYRPHSALAGKTPAEAYGQHDPMTKQAA